MEEKATFLAEGSFRSPFHLNLVTSKRNKQILDPVQSESKSSPTVDGENDGLLQIADDSSSRSSLSSDSLCSPLINTNPFSLNLRKVSSVGLSQTSPTGGTKQSSPTLAGANISALYFNSHGSNNLTAEEKVDDLLKEIATLRKEIELRDQKLSSSVKSIKQFWSPELKKERAARKEEAERVLQITEKYEGLCSDVEDYKATVISQAKELDRLKSELKSLEWKSNNQTTEDELSLLKVKHSKQEEELAVLNRSLDELEGKYRLLEDQSREKSSIIDDLEKILDEQEHRDEERQQAIKGLEAEVKKLSAREHELEDLHDDFRKGEETLNALTKRFEKLQKIKDELQTAVKEKDRRLSDLNKQLEQHSNESERLRQQLKLVEESFLQEKKERSTAEQEALLLGEKLSNLEQSCACREKEANLAYAELDKLRKVDADHVDRIAELEDLFLSKDKEYDRLHDQLRALEVKIAESKQLLKDKEDELKLKSSVSVDEFQRLKSNLEAKEKEVTAEQKKALQMRGRLQALEKEAREKEEQLTHANGELKSKMKSMEKTIEKQEKDLSDLNAKYKNLDQYVSTREDALQQVRDDFKSVQEEHSKCLPEISRCQKQVQDRDSTIEKLERQLAHSESQRRRSVKADEESAKEELRQKYEQLVKATQEKNNELAVQVAQVDQLRDALQAKEAAFASLQSQGNRAEVEENENKELRRRIFDLEKELEECKKEVTTLSKKGRSASDSSLGSSCPNCSTSKENKSTKHLWDEITKKETRIEELEKQLKEKNRQISSIRKAQNSERAKEHLSNSEKQKSDDKLVSEIEDMKGEIGKKEQRIAMLEDALRESVSIAAEREDLLAQHVEMSEDAAKKISELEGEHDRLVIEKAITNIKNAFLILTLSEQDALVASLRAGKKRNIEELLNLKQDILLGAITEKDTSIAALELQNSKAKRSEILAMKADKEKLVGELKDQVCSQTLMLMMSSAENKEGSIISELEDAPDEQVFEAVRHLSASSTKLQFYIEELLTFLKGKNVELLKDVPSIPRRRAKSIDKLKGSTKAELMKELHNVTSDSVQLKKYVDELLDKLEG